MTKKEKIFNVYSKNLSWLKKNEKFRLEPDIPDSYICPLCFRVFPREALFSNTEAELTLDHNPPDSLDGTEMILTCRKCNSNSGSLLDAHLLKRLEEIDLLNFTPNTEKRVSIVKDGKKTNAFLDIDDGNAVNLKVYHGKTNPKNAEDFFTKMKAQNWDGFEFKLEFGLESLGKHAETALLKIAYLKTFKFFGNGFLMHPFLYAIRNQILSPEIQTITEPLGVYLKAKTCGISVISEPKELQSFLVSFKLKTKSKQHFFSVCLPGFSSPGLEIYQNLKKISRSENTKFKVHILDQVDYLSDESSVFAAQHFWKVGTRR